MIRLPWNRQKDGSDVSYSPFLISPTFLHSWLRCLCWRKVLTWLRLKCYNLHCRRIDLPLENSKSYRAVERYSARRLPSASLPSSSDGDISSSRSSSSSTRLKQANQIICRAASFYFSRFQKSILRSDLSLIGALRTWLTNLAFAAYVTFYSLPYHLLTEGKWSRLSKNWFKRKIPIR
jgi:hypothetical protein